MAPISANILPLLALLLASTTQAFVVPVGRGLQHRQHELRSASTTISVRPRSSSSRSSAAPRRLSKASATTARMSVDTADSLVETVEEKVARLRETAATFRAQAAQLEVKREEERRRGATRSFNTFDSNKDGKVDVRELQAGLAGPLRNSFTKQLTARMGRKPSREEVDARIAELPGGCLFPDDLAMKLIDAYDQNSDGVLQQSEFAPTEELRMRLENMFREQREEERQARLAAREREVAAKEVGPGVAVSTEGGVNDGEATTADKALAVLPYLLPLADGLSYAGHLFSAYPEQTAFLQPLVAVLFAIRSLPFATLIGFFALSALSNNPQVNKLARFNMKQAINFDIALIVPGIVGALTAASLGHDAYKLAPLAEAGSDVIFVALLAAVAYSVGSSALGEFPNKLPFFGRINRENPEQDES